ncbi:MAG: phosphoglycolate phosphatase [Pseudomonadota bacterium]
MFDQVGRRLMARIVFDLDGTLIDSAADIHALANIVLAEEGAAPLTLAQTRTFVGNGAPMFVTRMRAARGLPESDHDRLLARFVAGYSSAVDLTEVFAGVEDALATLRAGGHRLGICTNKPLAPAQAVLDHTGLAQYFDAVIGGDSLPTVKPDPAPLDAAFAALGTGPKVFVGDSDVDADAAVQAQVPFLLFAHGYARKPLAELPCDATFDSFDALPALITKVIAAAQPESAAPAP